MDPDNTHYPPKQVSISDSSIANKDELRFGKSQRVLSGLRFRKILHKGRCKADHLLVLCAIPTQTGARPRIGITIPKKTGNAVVRNHWKRLIREAFRTQQHQLPSGFDFVVRPKKGTIADSAAIHRSLLKLANRVTNSGVNNPTHPPKSES